MESEVSQRIIGYALLHIEHEMRGVREAVACSYGREQELLQERLREWQQEYRILKKYEQK